MSKLARQPSKSEIICKGESQQGYDTFYYNYSLGRTNCCTKCGKSCHKDSSSLQVAVTIPVGEIKYSKYPLKNTVDLPYKKGDKLYHNGFIYQVTNYWYGIPENVKARIGYENYYTGGDAVYKDEQYLETEAVHGKMKYDKSHSVLEIRNCYVDGRIAGSSYGSTTYQDSSEEEDYVIYQPVKKIRRIATKEKTPLVEKKREVTLYPYQLQYRIVLDEKIDCHCANHRKRDIRAALNNFYVRLCGNELSRNITCLQCGHDCHNHKNCTAHGNFYNDSKNILCCCEKCYCVSCVSLRIPNETYFCCIPKPKSESIMNYIIKNALPYKNGIYDTSPKNDNLKKFAALI